MRWTSTRSARRRSPACAGVTTPRGGAGSTSTSPLMEAERWLSRLVSLCASPSKVLPLSFNYDVFKDKRSLQSNTDGSEWFKWSLREGKLYYSPEVSSRDKFAQWDFPNVKICPQIFNTIFFPWNTCYVLTAQLHPTISRSNSAQRMFPVIRKRRQKQSRGLLTQPGTRH